MEQGCRSSEQTSGAVIRHAGTNKDIDLPSANMSSSPPPRLIVVRHGR